MADRLRIVTQTGALRPSSVLDLNQIVGGLPGTYSMQAGTFAQSGPAKTPIRSVRQRRLGGAQVVGEIHDNSTVSFDLLVRGTTKDDCLTKFDALLAALDYTNPGRLLEWRADGATYSSFYRIQGGTTWDPNYSWLEMQGVTSMQCKSVTVQTEPAVRGNPLDIEDFLDADTYTAGATDGPDWTMDLGSSADMAATAGTGTKLSANLASEHRLAYTVRGYQLPDQQVTIGGTVAFATGSGFKLGVLLKRQDANNYLEVYVDDNGTNSRLRIDKVVAGARTNLQSTNLTVRVGTTGALPTFVVRGRIEGNNVFAEFWANTTTAFFNYTAAPGAPSSIPAAYALTAGAEQTQFGTGTTGLPGWSVIPIAATTNISGFVALPYTYFRRQVPSKFQLTVPGTLPAICDFVNSLDANYIAPFGLVAFGKQQGAVANSPFAVREAESQTIVAGAATADASCSNGNCVQVTAPSTALTITFPVNPALLDPDPYADREIVLEVWARIKIASTVVGAKLVLSDSAREFDPILGTAGRSLPAPSSGTVYRYTRLGSLRLRQDAATSSLATVKIDGSYASGTGAFGIDLVFTVPIAGRTSSPTGKKNDATFPIFNESGTKIFTSDLRGTQETGLAYGSPTRLLSLRNASGLSSGAMLEPPPGLVDALFVISAAAVPDDPTISTNTDTAVAGTNPASVHFSITPRYEYARGG